MPCVVFSTELLSLRNKHLNLLHDFLWFDISFLFFSIEYYFIVHIHYSLFIQSPIEECLGCFQFGAIMNKAVINIHVQVFVWKKVFNSFIWVVCTRSANWSCCIAGIA